MIHLHRCPQCSPADTLVGRWACTEDCTVTLTRCDDHEASR